MENIDLETSGFFAKVPSKIVRFKWLVLSLIVLTSIFMAIGAITRTNISTEQNSFLDADDPAIMALDKFRLQFGSDDSVLLVYHPKDGDVFSKQSLLAVRALTHDLENWQGLDLKKFQLKEGEVIKLDDLKHIRRIRSLTNIRIQSATGDTLRSDRIIPKIIPDDPAALARIKQTALAQEDYKLAFYSADGQYGAILVETDFGAVLSDDFSPAIDDEAVVLGDDLAFSESDALSFDETAEIQEIKFKKADSKAYSSFYKQLKTVFSNYDESLTFYPVGYAPLASFVQGVIQQSMVLNLGMLILIILLLWSLFRSLSAVLWPIITIILSVVWVFGVFAWLGITLSSMVTLTIMLVLAVGIADCVHVMSAYMTFRREGAEHHQALAIAYDKTGLAIFVTSVTTVAGIAALAFSDLVPIRTFAMMSALGVIMAFIFTLFLLPILLDLWHPGKPSKSFGWGHKLATFWQNIPKIVKSIMALLYIALILAMLGPAIGGFIAVASILAYIVINWQQPILDRVLSITTRRPIMLLALFGTVLFACIYGTTQVRIDSNITELTREGSEVRVAYEIVDNNMAGTQNMEIMIDSNMSDGVLNPALLSRIDLLQRTIEREYTDEVGQTFSLANVVKLTNRVLHGDDPAYFRIPNTQQMIAQQLYLFNSANPDDRRSIVSDDYSQTHITVRVHNAGSEQFQLFFDEISKDIDTVFADIKPDFPDLDIVVTGSIPLYMRTQGAIANTQYSSFALALVVISIIMILTLGSIQAGLISIIPNILPALFTFGLMGLLNIPLDADTLLIAPVIMGIAVDDTIHFMTHYRLELDKTRDREEALKSTLMEVGQAVMITTMVLGLGFAILSFSDYLGTAKMGFFGGLAIFVALLCDLFLLPALLLIFKPSFGIKDIDTEFNFRGQSL